MHLCSRLRRLQLLVPHSTWHSPELRRVQDHFVQLSSRPITTHIASTYKSLQQLYSLTYGFPLHFIERLNLHTHFQMDSSSPSTSATPSQAEGKPEEAVYKTRAIDFFGRTVSIIHQNSNGPCSLISICNVLSLKNKLKLDPGEPEVSQEKLLALVAERLIDSNSKIDNKEAGYVENQQQNIGDAIELLPRLTTGIDVNIKFRRIDDFEFTPECAIFHLLDIPLYHGWVIDPQDIDTRNAIGSKSYDFLMKELVSLETQAKKYERIENLGVPSPSLSRSQSFTDSPQSAKKGDMEEAEQISRVLKLSMAESPSSEAAGGVVNTESEHMDSSEVLNSSIGVSEPIYEGEECILESGTAVYQNPVTIYEGEVAPAEQVDSGYIDVDPEERLSVEQGKLIRNYMRSNATQLTVYGLICLQNELKERELCVFFRNNHFNTMFKHEGELYILATDQGFISQPNQVWEKLNEVNGDTVYVMGNFKEFKMDDHSYGSWNEPNASDDNIASMNSVSRSDSNSNSDLQLALTLDLQQSLQPAVASGSGLITGPQYNAEEGLCIGYASFKSYAMAYGRWKASPFTKWFHKYCSVPGGIYSTIYKSRDAFMDLEEARKNKSILDVTLFKVSGTKLHKTRPWMITAMENLVAYGHILVADLDEVQAVSFLKANKHFHSGVVLGMWRSPTIFATDPAVKTALDELGIEHRIGESSFEARRAFREFCRRLAAYLQEEEDEKRLAIQFEEAKESYKIAETKFERLDREVKEIEYMQSQERSVRDKMKPLIQFLFTCNHIIVDSVDDLDAFHYLMVKTGYKAVLHSFNSAVIEEFKNHRGLRHFVESGHTLCYCHGRQSRLISGHPDPAEFDVEELRVRWDKKDKETTLQSLRDELFGKDAFPKAWLDEDPRRRL